MTDERSLYWQRTIDESGESQISAAHASTIDITKGKTLFMFPGADVTDHPNSTIPDPKQVMRAGLGILEHIIGGKEETHDKDMKLYSASWMNSDQISSHTKMLNFGDKSFFSPEAQMFVHDVLVKGLTKDGMKVSLAEPHTDRTKKPNFAFEGEKLPIKDVVENFNKITMVGYSVGNAFIQMVNNYTVDVMKGLGYDKDERKEALSAITTLGIANISKTNSTERFTSLIVTATNDKIAGERLPSFNQERDGSKVEVHSVNNLTFITGKVPNKIKLDLDEKGFKEIEDPKGHNIQLYLNQPEEGENKIATYIQNALRNAVNRSETIKSSTELLQSSNTKNHAKDIITSRYTTSIER